MNPAGLLRELGARTAGLAEWAAGAGDSSLAADLAGLAGEFARVADLVEEAQ